MPPVAANDSYFTQKTLLCYEFVPKDPESTLRKVPKCGFGELREVGSRVHVALSDVQKLHRHPLPP